jgi:hypothetical protein
MDAGIVKLLAANWQGVAMGLLVLSSGIGIIAYHSLTSNLRRYDPSQWAALGSPTLFSAKSISNESHFLWYILSLRYRKNEIRKIRIFGDVLLAYFVAIWIAFVCLVIFGNRYEFSLIFVENDRSGSESFSGTTAGAESQGLWPPNYRTRCSVCRAQA